MFVVLKSLVHTHMDIFPLNGGGEHYHVLEEGLGNGLIQLVVDRELQEIFILDNDINRIAFTDFDGRCNTRRKSRRKSNQVIFFRLNTSHIPGRYE